MPIPTPDIPSDLSRFLREVQHYMRDFSELNELIDGEESSPRLILLAMSMALSRYNFTPPLLGAVDFSSFPSREHLIQGTVIHLLDSANLLLARNSIAYSDGGLTVSEVESRYRAYREMVMEKRALWLAATRELKIALNLAEALGVGTPEGVHSEYYWISGAYGSN